MRLFVVIALVCCTAAQQCGRSYFPDRIVGGTAATPGAFPWMVSLQQNGYHFCGGTLLNSEWVLSAAHCQASASTLRVIVGENNFGSNEGTEQSTGAQDVIPHPNYNPNTYDNDIMLIKLSYPVTINSWVSPACLPSAMVEDGTDVTVTGWGSTHPSGSPYSYRLQRVNVHTIPRSHCNAAHSYNGQVTSNMFCAGHSAGGRDSCQGDSGGPGVRAGTVYGVVSWGFGCGNARYPGVYTKVANYVDWINSYIN
ncbi:PRSS2 [Branchiostoma lanceolatum]|uniref:PRSS2 protein n=1 Tax=Branchiostoma lanceolatum TaxID=7740 RepID=A0A8J9ZKJ1_BRALA|nr:PRSS2 [Branchiostoma lanceolatum]